MSRRSRTSRLYQIIASKYRDLTRLPQESTKVEALERLLGYTFHDKSLLVQAVTHPSANTKEYGGFGDYQRLEFLGDAVLDMLVVMVLFRKERSFQPQELNDEKSKVVRNGALALWGMKKLEIDRFIRLGSNVELRDALRQFRRGRQEGRNPDMVMNHGYPKAVADVVEALIAAVYLDSEGDMDRVAQVFLPFIMPGDVIEGTVGGEEEAKSSEGGENGAEQEDDDDLLRRLQVFFPCLPELINVLE